MESLRNQFLSLFFKICYFLFFVSNILFLCYFLHFYHSFSFLFFLLLLFLLLFLFFSFLFSSSASAILTFPALVFTTSHTLLDILSFLLLFFSSHLQDCDEQAIAFSKIHSTSNYQSHQSLFSPYATGNKYSLLLYA